MENQENLENAENQGNHTMGMPNEQMGEYYDPNNNPEERRFMNMKKRAITPRKRYNQYNSLMRASAPFNYYSNPNGTDGYVVCYNGGYLKRFHPLVTRNDLAKYLKARSLFDERQRAVFQKPENYFLPRPNCVPNPVVDRLYNKSQDNFYHRGRQCRGYERQPMIGNGMCHRYANSMGRTTRGGNKKIFYKMNNNEYCNNCPQNYYSEYDQNNMNMGGNEVQENYIPPKIEPQRNPEIKEQKIEEKKDEGNKEKKITSIFKPRTYRRFHKVQIFNNYKPFLVDGFKEYADYC